MDCLIIGYNDLDFSTVVAEVRSMGEDNVAFRDLNLNFVELNGKPYRALDVLNEYFNCIGSISRRSFSNHDLLWPAIPPIATYLDSKGLTFDYINNFNSDKQLLKAKLSNESIATIAITTTIYISDSPILEIINFVRQFNQSAKIVVGGPYMSKQTEEKDEVSLQAFLKYLGADVYVFSKEGEFALYRIIQELRGGGDLRTVDNIGYLQDDKYFITQTKGEDNPLDKNPINYSLFSADAIGEYVNVKTSKSCPFECSFCAFPLRAERYVYTDERWIQEQLDAIRKVGMVKNVFFSDDTFNIPLSRFKNIMRMMIAQKYPFRWHCFYRCGNSDEEAISLMRDAGCAGVFLGIESANDKILSIMNKKARRIDYATSVPLFRKYGILTFASIFAGFPGESYESYKETMDFIEETQPDFCRPLVWYCDTTTPIWKERDKYGIKGNSFNWSHNSMNSREACDLMEESFMSLKSPTVYVPDPGFNFISIYYLLQRGFSIDHIKSFLTNFNNAVKVKILFPAKKDLPSVVLENLQKSCDLSISPDQLNCNVLSQYSGQAYDAALKYWLAKFKTYDFSSKLFQIAEGSARLESQAAMTYYHYKLSNSNGQENQVALIGSISFLLSYLEGYSTMAFLYVTSEGHYFPLRIDIDGSLTFSQFRTSIIQEVRRSQEHRMYGFHILANPYRLRKYQLESPTIRYALFETSIGYQHYLDEIATSFPSVYHNIGLCFQADHINKTTIGVQLTFSSNVLSNIDRIKMLLMLTLDQVLEAPDIRLSDIRFSNSSLNMQSESMRRFQKDFKF